MNRKSHLTSKLLLTLGVSLCAASPALATANVLFILDGSGSMWERVDGQPKIAIAKTVLNDALKGLPQDTATGLMSYGLNRKGDCKDIELLSPIGPNNTSAISGLVNGLTPKGDTPIAGALLKAGDAFKGVDGDKMIVLVTDGAEECNGDPCAAAKTLADADVKMHINIVGFNLADKQRQAVQCIADEGRGKYFDAKDSAALTSAMTQLTTEVKVADAAPAAAAPAPAAPAAPATPAAPTFKTVFSDNFSGSALGPEWTVLNPAPDNYAVDGGKLLIVTSAVDGLAVPTLPNIMEYNKPMPDGDWVVTVKFGGVMQTGQEHIEIGLRDDEKNFLGAAFKIYPGDFYAYARVEAEKVANGAPPVVQAMDVKQIGAATDIAKLSAPLEPFTLKLTKTGRSYVAAVALAGEIDKDGKQVWYSPGEVTSLKAPKNLVLAASENAAVKGETTFEIQSVTIEQVAQ